MRKRAYIRLAEDFEVQEPRTIKPAAVERALLVLEDFVSNARGLGATTIVAVATGVVRAANNQAAFLKAIRSRTGIEVKTVMGQEEAFLTGLGVRHALQINKEPFVIFDLGGGTTEFLIGVRGAIQAFSLPLGAAIYTCRFIKSDPPCAREVETLEEEISSVMQAFRLPAGRVLAADQRSTLTVPPHDNASMDGYAVRLADLDAAGCCLPVSQRIPAGHVGAPLAAGESVDLRLEYFVPTRLPVAIDDAQLQPFLQPGFNFTPPEGTPLPAPAPRLVPWSGGSMLLEFPATPGRTYMVLYRDNSILAMELAAQPALVATGDRVQWIDNGPPKTLRLPGNAGARFYRVIQIP